MTTQTMTATVPLWRSLLNLVPFVAPARTAGANAPGAERGRGPRESGGGAGSFERDVAIRFAHCDPAGIVFYPQYFIIMNGLMEDWFSEGLGIEFADMVTRRKIGIPTVKIDCTFSRPSRIGEIVTFGVSVTRTGERSIGVEVRAVANGELRLHATQTIVMMCLETMKSIPIPPDVRAMLPRFRRDGQARADVPAPDEREAIRAENRLSGGGYADRTG